MTIERDDLAADKLVSETYRELANEVTPEYLNETVLTMAANPPPLPSERDAWYSAWLKPAAVAATVGLSLAIAIETTQLGINSDESRSDKNALQRSIATEPVRDQFEPQDGNVLIEAEEFAKLTSGSNQEHRIEAGPRNTAAAPDEIEFNAPASASVSAAPAPAEIAEKDAQYRAKTARRSATSFEMMTTASDDDFACDTAARETAASWYVCIEDLLAAGKTADADREKTAFALLYPDYRR